MNPAEELEALAAPGGPYEMSLVDAGRGPVPVFVNGPATLRDLYEQNISDQPFLVEDGLRLTFAQTHERAAVLANLLTVEHGVAPGDRVAISMRNHVEWLLAFIATTSIGAIAVAMNSMWTPDEMGFALADCGAKVLVADEERIDRAIASGRAEVDGVAILGARMDHDRKPRARVVDLADIFAGNGRAHMPQRAITPDDPASILYTSGSTGNPKGVVSTHRNIVSALLAWELHSRQQTLRTHIATGVDPVPAPRPVALLAVPLFHVLGLHSVFLSSYRSQRTLVCMSRWNPVEAARIIERERVTSFSGPPTMTGDLLRVAETGDHDLSSLLTVGGGGAARAPEQVARIDSSFRAAAPGTGWGMTETAASGTTISGAEYLARPTSAGRALAVVQLRIVDDDGSQVGPGVAGELQVRGAVVFREYWNRPDATAESFTPDGWFRTGDVARIDDEGYLFIVDRIKDLIIRGGENIGCGHVEAALLEHPDVLEAAVYALPDDRLGEEVGATVHATDALDLEDLRRFLADRLATHELPRYIEVSVQPLARTGSGKLFKRAIRDEAIARMTPVDGGTEADITR